MALDVLLEPCDVGALTFPAAGRFYDDRDRGRTDDFRKCVGADFAVAKVGVPIGA